MTAVAEKCTRPNRARRFPSFEVTLRICALQSRQDDGRAQWEDFTVKMYGTDRVLDALHEIKWHVDGSLTFRRSCAHGICGSDAMRINGRNRLACKTLLKDLDINEAHHRRADQGPAGREGPDRRHGAVLRLLPRGACPSCSRTGGQEPSRERLQTAEERERFDDTTKCILCAACTSSCPVFWTDGQYFGPAAIVNAHRFIFDSRDDAGRAASRDPQLQGGRVALPHDLQLHRGVPPRHPGDQGDRRGEAGRDHRSRLSCAACSHPRPRPGRFRAGPRAVRGALPPSRRA